MILENADSLAKIQRVTVLGMGLDIALGGLKIVVGILAYSQALIADGVHSLSDALTDIFVIIMTRIARAAPDGEHPYGHARFETLGTVILGISLVTVAGVLGYENAVGLTFGETTQIPGWPAIVVASVSIICKEWIFHYTRRHGEALRSNLLTANAWHSRTDAISSLIVLIGVIGTMAGFMWLDRLAAVIVAVIIAKIGFDFVRDGLADLVDTGLAPELTQAISNSICQTPGVRDLHALRTRKMGADTYLDVHLLVAPDISISEGHQIGEWVTKRLLTEFDFIRDITCHIDHEDDSAGPGPELLPLRDAAISVVAEAWKPVLRLNQGEEVKLQYLGNKVQVELYMSQQHLSQTGVSQAELQQQLNNAAAEISWFGGVSVWVGINPSPPSSPRGRGN